MMTDSLSKQSSYGEDSVRECVWESCCTVSAKPINLHVFKRKIHHSKRQQMDVESSDSVEHTNRVKQKNGTKSKNKRNAENKKKINNCSAEKLNVNYKNEICLPLETIELESQDVNVPLRMSTVACARKECVENVGDYATELSARFGHDSCTQQARISACTSSDADDSINLLQTGLLSTAVCQIDMAGLPGKNTFTEYFNKDNSTVNDIVCMRDYKVKMQLLMTNIASCQFHPTQHCEHRST